MQKKFGSDNFGVIGVMQGGELEAQQFISELGATYPILTGASETFDSWGVSMIPQAYLINPDGVVVADGIDDVSTMLTASLK